MKIFIETNRVGSAKYDITKPDNQITFMSYNKNVEADHLIEIDAGDRGDYGLINGYYIDNKLYRFNSELENLKLNTKQDINNLYNSNDYKKVSTLINDKIITVINNIEFRTLISEQISFMKDSVLLDDKLDINKMYFDYHYEENITKLSYQQLIFYRVKLKDSINKLFYFKENLLLQLKNIYQMSDLENRDLIQEMIAFKAENNILK